MTISYYEGAQINTSIIPPSLSIVTIHTIRNFRVGSKDENPNKTVYERNVGVIASSFWTRHLTLDRTMPLLAGELTGSCEFSAER